MKNSIAIYILSGLLVLASSTAVAGIAYAAETTWYGATVCHKGVTGECPVGQECDVWGTDKITGTCKVSNAGGGNPPTTSNVGGGNPPASSGGGSGLQNPLKVSSFPEFLNAILGGIVEIGAIFLTVMIVYVGFLFVAARGNEEKIRDARNALVWVVIGGLILLGAQAISLVIQSTVTSITA